MTRPVGIGLIGASPDRGWAMSSHLPALLDGGTEARVRLAAAGTSRPETAARAAARFGVPGYADYRELIADPAVEAVTVSVKLPLHHEIVSAAIAAGKHVFCEWPLGRTLAEAEDLAKRARAAGVRTMIGLQSRASPVLDRFGALLREGYVGEILSVSVLASGFGWGAAIDPGNAYLFDRENGATLLTITGGHLIDAVANACGGIVEVAAALPTRRREIALLPPDALARFRAFAATVEVAAPGAPPNPSPTVVTATEHVTQTSPDQVLVIGRLESGAPLSVHVRGGMLRSTGLLIEVIGTEGELRVTGPAGVIQMMPLTLSGARGARATLEPIDVADDGRHAMGPIAGNIARLYDRFAQDIRSGSRLVPDFDDAVRLHRLMAAIEAADESGRRTPVA